MDPATINLLIQLGIPIVSTLLVAGTKTLIPKLPKVVQPVLAGFFGFIITALGSFTSAPVPGLATGALLGLSGVGVREVVDQAKKATGKSS